jgi:hypothetical protein
MKVPKRESYFPTCMLTHDLLNNLSVIVGHCDLLRDPDRTEAERAEYLAQILKTAQLMADRLKDHQCRPTLAERTAPGQQENLIG